MLNNVKKNNLKNLEADNLVEDVIKYKIKKYGQCGLKLIFTTITGEFYKDESIQKFDGSLLDTCQSLLRSHAGQTIAVDGIYNSENDSYKAKPYLIFKNGIGAANLEYIESLDFKNPLLEPDVKLCIINSVINSANSHILLEPSVFPYLIDAVKNINSLSYKVDLKNTLTLLEYIANNVKYYVKSKKDSYMGTTSNDSKIAPEKALELLNDVINKFERIDNNDLIMAVYRIAKCIKSLNELGPVLAYESIQ